jgi:uncharacterized membrane protein (UPF0127 family)
MLSTSITACAASGSTVSINGHKVEVEVVRSQEKQALGLMYRTEMAENHGMLFIYKQSAPLSFWMKNTRIPLDILYFDQHLKLINISANTPPCKTPRCPGYPSHAPAQYVLEINAGLARQWQIEPGEQLILHLD